MTIPITTFAYVALTLIVSNARITVAFSAALTNGASQRTTSHVGKCENDEKCIIMKKSSFGHIVQPTLRAFLPSLKMGVDDEDSELFPPTTSVIDSDEENEEDEKNDEHMIVHQVKEELLSLASITKRGFDSTRSQKKLASDLANRLAEYNPSREPAAAFYPEGKKIDNDGGLTLAGKWELIYTDAPDIVSLDGGPFSASKLGRIGQECDPPFIKNVIEWEKPDWAKAIPLPLSGTDESRVLQKVCCEAVGDPDKPLFVDLRVAGLDLLGFGGSSTTGEDKKTSERKDGLAKYLEENPVELRGPLKLPFGRFEVLYLDDELRIIRTNQNYLAINKRLKEAWF